MMTKGARCSGSTSVSKTEGAGSIPAAPASFPLVPGYCGTCGTINPGDWMDCGGEHCYWISLLPGWPDEEPRRAA